MIVVQLLQWCASCVGAGHTVPAGIGVLAGAAGAAGGIGALGPLLGGDGPQPLPANPAAVPDVVDSPPTDAPTQSPGPAGAPADLVPPTANPLGGTVGTGPEGSTVTTSADGQSTITLPDGTVIQATTTGGGGFAAGLPDGNVLTRDASGTTSLQLPDGSTQNWDAAGHYTGTAPPDLGAGGSLDAPPLAHDVVVPTSDGGYRTDHPDGSSDIHYGTGAVVHVEPDGIHWHQTRGPSVPS